MACVSGRRWWRMSRSCRVCCRARRPRADRFDHHGAGGILLARILIRAIRWRKRPGQMPPDERVYKKLDGRDHEGHPRRQCRCRQCRRVPDRVRRAGCHGHLMFGALPPVAGLRSASNAFSAYIFSPVALVPGHPEQRNPAGRAPRHQMVLTEFTAFIKLGAIPAAEMTNAPHYHDLCAVRFRQCRLVGINLAGYSCCCPTAERIIDGGQSHACGFLAPA